MGSSLLLPLTAAVRLLIAAFAVLGLLTVSAHAEPGRLLQATPLAGAPAGAKAWRIRYETRDKDGRRTESTGVAVVPMGRAPAGGRDVVAWAHGTTGIVEACAPSLGKKAVSGIPGVSDMVGRGWAVVATDYPGLGTKGPHGYLVGDAAAFAVLDSVRALRSLTTGVGSRYAVWGHSQGGHAALFTGEHARRYAPELQLMGVVAAAPPTDLAANLGSIGATLRGVLTALTAQSWSVVYGADLSTIASPATQGIIRRTANTCDGDSSLGGLIRVFQLRKRLGEVDLTDKEPWRGLLARNSVGVPPAATPLMVIQGNADPLISPAVTRAFVGLACGAGVRLRYYEPVSKDHATIAITSAGEAMRWMQDRFDGRSAPSTCR